MKGRLHGTPVRTCCVVNVPSGVPGTELNLRLCRGTGMRPNPSLERTSTGKTLGPRASQCHHPSRGPSALPAAAAQLKR